MFPGSFKPALESEDKLSETPWASLIWRWLSSISIWLVSYHCNLKRRIFRKAPPVWVNSSVFFLCYLNHSLMVILEFSSLCTMKSSMMGRVCLVFFTMASRIFPINQLIIIVSVCMMCIYVCLLCWLESRGQRSDLSFTVGSRDLSAGCQACVASPFPSPSLVAPILWNMGDSLGMNC